MSDKLLARSAVGISQWLPGRGLAAGRQLIDLWADEYARLALFYWLVFCSGLVYYLLSLPYMMVDDLDITAYYFPMAADFLRGAGPPAMLRDDLHGPGYPLLLALVARLAGSVPEAARWVALAGWPIFLALGFFVVRRAAGSRLGLGVLLLLSVSPNLSHLVIPSNDVVFLVLMYAALWTAMTRRYPGWWLAGMLSGLSLVVRWQGLFLITGIAAGSILIWVRSRRNGWAWMGALTLFVFGVLLTASPFLYFNHIFRGNALANANLANIPAAWLPDGVVQQGTDLVRDGRVINSLPQLIRQDPVRVLGNWAKEATTGALFGRVTCGLPGGCDSWLAKGLALFIPAGVLALIKGANRRLGFLLACGYVVWWGCLPNAVENVRILLPIWPLVCLSFVGFWLSDWGMTTADHIAEAFGRAIAFVRANLWSSVLVVCAFLVRLLTVLIVPTQPRSDAEIYLNIARDIVAGQGLPDMPYWPVGYPLFLAALLKISASLLAMKAANVLLGTASVFLAYRLGRLLYSESAGRIAGLLMAFYPSHILLANLLFFPRICIYSCCWLVSTSHIVRRRQMREDYADRCTISLAYWLG